MTKLIIDTTDNKETTIKLETSEYSDEITQAALPKSQNTLILIDKILKKNKIKATSIDEIEVNAGPGSYTGTRIGVAIANALGFALNKKVNGGRPKIVVPKYF